MVSFKSLNFNTFGYTLLTDQLHLSQFLWFYTCSYKYIASLDLVFKFVIDNEELSENTKAVQMTTLGSLYDGLCICTHTYMSIYMTVHLYTQPPKSPDFLFS